MSITRKIRTIGYLSALSTVMFVSAGTAGRIDGSAHDFEDKGWSGGDLCTVCHTPHNAATVEDAPLWNHDLSEGPWTMYTSPTFDATISATPDGSSLLCLSCHDGTVALDSYGGTTGSVYIGGENNLGTDLSNDHPISIIYDTDLVNLDGGLFEPTTQQTTIGIDPDAKTGTVDDLMLFNTKVQCASCHDVHNRYTVDEKLLKITNVGSALCLTCHDK